MFIYKKLNLKWGIMLLLCGFISMNIGMAEAADVKGLIALWNSRAEDVPKEAPIIRREKRPSDPAQKIHDMRSKKVVNKQEPIRQMATSMPDTSLRLPKNILMEEELKPVLIAKNELDQPQLRHDFNNKKITQQKGSIKPSVSSRPDSFLKMPKKIKMDEELKPIAVIKKANAIVKKVEPMVAQKRCDKREKKIDQTFGRSMSYPRLTNAQKSANSIPAREVLGNGHPLYNSKAYRTAQLLMQKQAMRSAGNPYRNDAKWQESSRGLSLGLSIKSKFATKGLTKKDPDFWKKMGKVVSSEPGAPISCDQSAALAVRELSKDPAFKSVSIEVVAIGNPSIDGHFIVVVGRNQKGDINKRETWGENSFIVDVWDAVQFPEDRNIVTSVENYKCDDFTKNEKSLTVVSKIK